MTIFNDSDHRYLPRWEVNNRVLYHIEPNHESHHGQTCDLSYAGARISTTTKPDIAQQIDMTVFLAPHSPIKIKGHVLWTRETDAQHSVEMGVRFDNPDPQTQDLILQHAFEMNPNSETKP
jgi:c-di-GMP-binding flagellar brake protein YcgR